MLLRKILLCMILAGVIEYTLWIFALRFFENRFLKKAEVICYLYDSICQYIETNYEGEKAVQITVKYNKCKAKIKFRNASEACLEFEALVSKIMRDYKIARWLDGTKEETDKFEIDEAKEFIEEICCEMKNIMNMHVTEEQQKEL